MSKIGEWFQSWRLVSWRTAVVVALVLYTLIGFLVVPWIAESVVTKIGQERLGREITIENIDCNPFTLSLTVEGFSLPDRPGTQMLAFDRMYANLQASSLFRWAFTLKEVRVDRPYIALRRFEDKGVNVVELVEAFKSTAPPADPDAEGGLLRTILEEIVISDGRLEVENRASDIPLSEEWSPLDIELHNVSTLRDQSGDKEITLQLPAGGIIRIAGSVVLEPFGLDGSLSIDKIEIANFWQPLESRFEFDIDGGTAVTELAYNLALEDDGLHLKVRDAELRVADLLVNERSSGDEILRADSVLASGIDFWWPEQRIEAESLTIDGAAASAWLMPDGTPAWEAWVPEPTRDQVVEAYEYVGARVDIDAELGSFAVSNAAVNFEDRTFAEPRQLGVSDAALSLTDVSSTPGTKWGLEAAASIAGESRATAKGTFGAIPVELEAEVSLESLELSQFQAYVARFAPLDLKAGLLSVSGSAQLAPSQEAPDVRFQGELSVSGLNLDETVTNGPLLGWGDLKVAGIDAALAPTSLGVEKVDVFKAGLEISVDPEGKINLLEFFDALGEPNEGATSTAGSSGDEGALPPVQIRQLELHDCYGLYKDATTVEPMEARLEKVNGTISKIATDGKTPAELDIEAAVATGGGVRVNGRLAPFDYQRFTDIDLDIREAHLPPMSMMSIKTVGFPIESGRATLGGSYDINDQQLVSTNHIEIDNLSFGEKVEGQGKINLPVKMGVSLLKDKNGRITLDVPIEGNLGDPEFLVSSAVAAAAKDLVGEVAKAPFRMLARLGGGSPDQNLDVIDFEAGSSVLSSSASANLETLAKALDERPALTLEIEGTFDSRADALGLRRAAFSSELGDETEATVPTARLEKMFGSQISTSELDVVRQEHTPSVEGAELDEESYREALIARLIEAQSIDETQIPALGPVRAEAIRTYLVEQAGIESTRVTVLPETVDAATGEDRVRCRLTLGSSKG